jgi:thiol:disulfide interchange protein DsbA
MLGRALLALFAALALGSAHAQPAPIAGVDYEEMQQAPAARAGDALEVVEFFWYRCPHCYALEPLLEPWIARLPSEARFRRIPAVLGKEWLLDARVFYALEQIGELERLHRPLMDAIHQQGGRRLDGNAYARWVAEWLGKNGVDAKRYAAALDSAAVREKAARAAELSAQFKLEGTPTFMVAGRYVVNPAPGDRRRILEITDYLISRLAAGSLARR